MLTRLTVCGYIGLARLIELAFSRRNIARQTDAVEGVWSRRSFPLVVLLHTVVGLGTLALGGRPRRPWLLLLVLLQPLRYWTLMTLGPRWNARGAVAPDLQVATNGPYAYVRHPNYTVVILELLALPMAFGLSRLALFAGAANALLLLVRIRDEEALLRPLPGYREHFDRLPRFLPRLF